MLQLTNNQDPKSTAFTVTCDAVGTTTGVSGEDRALTFKTLADRNCTPDKISRPGHIFPLVAKDGGVLERRGHTEAGVDLCVLSGCSPVGLLCEMTNDDGTMMRLSHCEKFAEDFGLKLINIDQMAKFREKEGYFTNHLAGFFVLFCCVSFYALSVFCNLAVLLVPPPIFCFTFTLSVRFRMYLIISPLRHLPPFHFPPLMSSPPLVLSEILIHLDLLSQACRR